MYGFDTITSMLPKTLFKEDEVESHLLPPCTDYLVQHFFNEIIRLLYGEDAWNRILVC